jgi:hypothetical protein
MEESLNDDPTTAADPKEKTKETHRMNNANRFSISLNKVLYGSIWCSVHNTCRVYQADHVRAAFPAVQWPCLAQLKLIQKPAGG